MALDMTSLPIWFLTLEAPCPREGFRVAVGRALMPIPSFFWEVSIFSLAR
jgi:hypothetical protein